MPTKMSENLSVPLAFVALLHLCNERCLALSGVSDFSDFNIRQGWYEKKNTQYEINKKTKINHIHKFTVVATK